MEIRSVHEGFEVSDYNKAMEFYGSLFRAGGFTKGWGDGSTYVGYSLGFFALFIGQSEQKRVIRIPVNPFVVAGFSLRKLKLAVTGPVARPITHELSGKRINRLPPTGNEFVVTDHVGVSLGTREDVETIADAMLKAGIKPLFPAQEYPEFGPGFFAVTFCDPDHNVIEFGHRSVPAGSIPPKIS